MKKILLSVVSTALLISSNAQVIDTVSLGGGYANQKWYSLENDEQGSSPKNNWDIAFDCSGFGSSIHINSVTGTLLWKYPTADTAGWSAVDTSGLSGWAKLFNSDTTWSIGAFDKGIVLSNPNDLGWGVYNSLTHIVSGDSIYIIKLASGAYKKLWIQSLASGTYTFKYADLSGSGLQNGSLVKSGYTGKNFGYYSLQTNAAVDREPVSANWDLSFMQYTTFIPAAYGVSGIMTNAGVRTAQANNIGNTATYIDWGSHSYTTRTSEIGYDWKTFTGTTYAITDSLIYFVITNAGDLWKVIPTGFGGSANGNMIFSKEKLSSTSITDQKRNETALLSVYPNPSSNGNTTIIYDSSTPALLQIYDITGKSIFSEKLMNTGLNTYTLNTEPFNSGIYIVAMETEGKLIRTKLIIQ
jgi:type IX secretion system substrate protein